VGVFLWCGLRRKAAPRLRALLGGKGANLAEMSNLGLPVPPGFTITTEACTYFYKNKQKISPPILKPAVEASLKRVGDLAGPRALATRRSRLLVSVRSGAARVHARYDGHGPEPRSQPENGRRPGEADRGRTLRFTIPYRRLYPDVFGRGGSRSITAISKKSSKTKSNKGVELDTDLDRPADWSA